MPKKEISGGRRRRQRKTRLRARKGNMARAQGNSHLGDSRNRLLMVLSHLPLRTANPNPFSSCHILPPKGGRPRSHNSLPRVDGSSRSSLGFSDDNFKEVLQGAVTKGLNAGLLWPRSRVFVIIASTPPLGANLPSEGHLKLSYMDWWSLKPKNFVNHVCAIPYPVNRG
jgi:hypothetical protein